MNNTYLPDDWHLEEKTSPADNTPTSSSSSFFDLFRHRLLLRKTLILYLNWFTTSLVYYGLTLNAGSLGGDDPFATYMINGAMEVPAYAAAIVMLLFAGRRLPYAAALIAAGENEIWYTYRGVLYICGNFVQ